MICNNLEKIKFTIRQAATKSKRDPETIKLVAVSKRKPTEAIREANRCGQLLFGENYIQEAREKIQHLNPELQWHFIGHLQSNKAKDAAKFFQLIETVDRIKIAKVLNKFAGQYDKILNVLVQVNIGAEPQKSGIAVEDTEALLQDMKHLPHLRVQGLMTTPPYGHQPEDSRSWFRALKELSVKIAAKELFTDNENVELSMGMSGDYVVAIEEGATIVRVGTAIFGSR